MNLLSDLIGTGSQEFPEDYLLGDYLLYYER